jgi:hypothetical protein
MISNAAQNRQRVFTLDYVLVEPPLPPNTILTAAVSFHNGVATVNDQIRLNIQRLNVMKAFLEPFGGPNQRLHMDIGEVSNP